MFLGGPIRPTPRLHEAISNNETSFALELIKNGASIEVLSKGRTPLYQAITFRRTRIALALIKKGADIEASCDGQTPLQKAIIVGKTRISLALIRKGANIEVMYEGQTPLQMAIIFGKTKIALGLIKKGANIEATYRDTTPLQRANYSGQTKIALALIERGAAASIDELFRVLELTQKDLPEKTYNIQALLERLHQNVKTLSVIKSEDSEKYYRLARVAYQSKKYDLVDDLLAHETIASRFYQVVYSQDLIAQGIHRRGVTLDFYRAAILDDRIRFHGVNCDLIIKEITQCPCGAFGFLEGKSDFFITAGLANFRKLFRKIREERQAPQEHNSAAPAASVVTRFK